MKRILEFLGILVAAGVGLSGGCGTRDTSPDGSSERPSAAPSAPATSPSQPALASAEATPAAESALAPAVESAPAFDVSPEQIAAAKKLAEDLGVLIQEDAAGHVILLDTAAKRSWVDDYQLQEMLVFPHLQSLTIEGPSISDVVAPYIAKLPLSTLAMRNTLITNEGIATLQGMKSLKVIDLRLSPLLNDAAVELLAGMPQLRAVRLLGVNVTDRGVAALLRMPQLAELDLRNCRGITQAGLQQMAEKNTVRSLKIGGTSVDDGALGIVARMKQLRSLSVDNSAVTDTGVAQLKTLSLVELTIYQCSNITDTGLQLLSSQADLQRLTLRDIKAQGAALSLVPNPEKLVELNMALSGVTDADVANFARFSGLRSLTLSETTITDAAVDALAKLTSLTDLTIAQTRMTEDGIARLRAALPKCEVRTL